jgi:hypothetical protein
MERSVRAVGAQFIRRPSRTVISKTEPLLGGWRPAGVRLSVSFTFLSAIETADPGLADIPASRDRVRGSTGEVADNDARRRTAPRRVGARMYSIACRKLCKSFKIANSRHSLPTRIPSNSSKLPTPPTGTARSSRNSASGRPQAARLLVQRCSPENSKPSGVVRTFDLTTGGCNE